MRRLLIMSDRCETRVELVQHFLQKGFAVSAATRSETATTLVDQSTGFDLLLLDMRDPSEDVHLIHQMRARAPDAGILMMVDPADLNDGLRDLDLGADDFVVRPLRIREVELRIEALFRQHALSDSASSWRCTVRDLTLDFSTRTCYRDGKCITLTAKEFDLLGHLFRNRGRTVDREALVEHIWGTPQAIAPRTIDRYVTAIRQKIEEDPSSPVYLQTVYGKGYRFISAE